MGKAPINTVDRRPPTDEEAERAVVASCLADAEAMTRVAPLLVPGDFANEHHGWIYDALLTLHKKHQINTIMLMGELRQRGKLDAIGGPFFVSKLFDSGLSPLMAEGYAARVREASIKRALINAGGRIAGLGFQYGDDAGELVRQAQGLIKSVTDRQAGTAWLDQNAIIRAFDDGTFDLAELAGDTTPGIATGLIDLDAILCGLRAPDLTIAAARPGVGKTAFALHVTRHACEHKKRVAFFSLEMSVGEIADRLVANISGIDLTLVRDRRLSKDEGDKVCNALTTIGEWALQVDETGRLGIDDLCNRAAARYAQEPFDLLIVDYVQYVSGRRLAGGTREQEVASVTRELKALAKELRVPVLALSQLNRAIEARAVPEPQLSDLRESGAIEQDASIVLFLHRAPGETVTQLIVAKNRNGKTDRCAAAWLGSYQRFGDLDAHHAREAA